MARGKGIVPHWYFPSLEEVDLDMLESLGIRGVVLDLDNTIVAGSRSEVSPQVKAWLKRARQKGFRLCIFSNTLRIRRLWKISREIGIPYIRGSFKPRRGGLRRALGFLRVSPKESVMIGDRLLTDIWGGNRMGMWTILVGAFKEGEGLATRIFKRFERFLLYLLSKGEHMEGFRRQNK